MGVAGYGEAAAPAALAERVACVWWLAPPPASATPPSEGGAGHLVLPDGCVDVLWHAGRVTIAGPDTRPKPAAPWDGTTVGVRLRPGAAPTLGSSAAAMRDERIAADELWGARGARLQERCEDAPDDGARLGLLLAAVTARTSAAPPLDRAVVAATALLDDGRSTVRAVAAASGLGERQLRRRFHDHVGYGPKTLHRVLRLQRLLTLAATTDDGLAALASAAGYADQAHAARDARDLAATTPAALVAARRPTTETSKTLGRASTTITA